MSIVLVVVMDKWINMKIRYPKLISEKAESLVKKTFKKESIIQSTYT